MLFPCAPRYKPIISHKPGISLWLSLSSLKLTLFPARIDIFSDPLIDHTLQLYSVEIPVQGPIEKWTVQYMYYKSQIQIDGVQKDKTFFRYIISELKEGTLKITWKKGFQGKGDTYIDLCHCIKRHDCDISSSSHLPIHERLDLGGNKALIWEKRISDVKNIKEILQEWYSFFVPVEPPTEVVFSQTLLGDFLRLCLYHQTTSQIEERSPFKILSAILQVGLDGIFTFISKDTHALGYSLPAFLPNMTTPSIGGMISFALRRLLFTEKQRDGLNVLFFENEFFKTFHSGRVWNNKLFTVSSVQISFEWRKQKPRRFLVEAKSDCKLLFQSILPIYYGFIRIGRISSKKQEYDLSKPVELKSHVRYLYDSFSCKEKKVL